MTIRGTMPVALQTKTYNVLIVDDEINVVESVKLTLEDIENIEFETAYNGIEALAKLDKYLPHLIILDGNMPKADGSTVVKEIKRNEQLKNIKILGFTGSIEEVRNFQRLGVDKIIIKGSLASDIDNFQKEVCELLGVTAGK
jgi:CheY-like chemotaxis protein